MTTTPTKPPYTPQPGTFAARAIAYLCQQPAGTQRSAAELAEALGQPYASIVPLLLPALKAGLLQQHRTPGERAVRFSLGSGTPPPPKPAIDGEEEDISADEPLRTHARPPVVANHALASPWALASQACADAAATTEPTPQPATAATQQPSTGLRLTPKARRATAAAARPLALADEQPLRCALWSDGRLTLQRGSTQLDLDAEHTRQLLAYLDRLREAA